MRYKCYKEILLICAAMSMLSCAEDTVAPVRVGSVVGVVLMYGTGVPVKGATVVLVNITTLAPVSPQAVTNNKGEYAVIGANEGQYVVYVYHESLVAFSRTGDVVAVVGGGSVEYDVLMTEAELWNGNAKHIVGRVIDAVSGEPISGAYVSGSYGFSLEVYLMMIGISHPDWCVTDEHGWYSVTSQLVVIVPCSDTEETVVTCVKQGYIPKAITVGAANWGKYIKPSNMGDAKYDSNTVYALDVELYPITQDGEGAHGAISGRLLHHGEVAADVEVALALVCLADESPPYNNQEKVVVPGATGISNSDGYMSITGLAPGWYRLATGYLVGDGYGPVNLSYSENMVEVLAGGTAALGDVVIIKEIETMSPDGGAIVVTSTPLLTWSPVMGAESYEVQWRVDGFVMTNWQSGISDTQYQINEEEAFPSDSCVRWHVEARRMDLELGYSVLVASTESGGIFCVEY